MSLLPGQILPQEVSLGKANADGTVTIAKDWWLFLYNIANQVLLPGSTATTLSLTEIGLTNRSGTDTARQIADLNLQAITLPNPAGRIAALERQVADLQTTLFTLRGT